MKRDTFAMQLSPQTCAELAALYRDDRETFTMILGALFRWIAAGDFTGIPTLLDNEELPIMARAYLSNLAEGHRARLKAYRGHRKA